MNTLGIFQRAVISTSGYFSVRVNMDDVRWHDLRHSAASALVQANVPIYTVAKILGHSTVQHTARYSHLADETLLSAVETAANALGQDWSKAEVTPA